MATLWQRLVAISHQGRPLKSGIWNLKLSGALPRRLLHACNRPTRKPRSNSAPSVLCFFFSMSYYHSMRLISYNSAA